jgi:hypothetical protein
MMSHNILNIISEIRGGRPVGIVKHAPTNPCDFPMYGCKDGVTIGQHLNEFDSWKDIKGRSFDQAVTAGLLDNDTTRMPPPPVPTTSKASQAKRTITDVHDYMDRFENHHITVSKQHLVVDPEYQKAVKKRKMDEDALSAIMRAENAKVLDAAANGTELEAPTFTGFDEARKRPFQKSAHITECELFAQDK